jgi:hypothetical protein
VGRVKRQGNAIKKRYSPTGGCELAIGTWWPVVTAAAFVAEWTHRLFGASCGDFLSSLLGSMSILFDENFEGRRRCLVGTVRSAFIRVEAAHAAK